MILPDLAATADAGARIAAQLRTGDTVTLSGPLGVGKIWLTVPAANDSGYVAS